MSVFSGLHGPWHYGLLYHIIISNYIISYEIILYYIKYITVYHIISHHIVSYLIISYLIISYIIINSIYYVYKLMYVHIYIHICVCFLSYISYYCIWIMCMWCCKYRIMLYPIISIVSYRIIPHNIKAAYK